MNRERTANDLADLYDQLTALAARLQRAIGRELLVVRRYARNGPVLVQIMNSDLPGVPGYVCHINLSRCACISLFLANIQERSWEDGLRDLMEKLAHALEDESQAAHSRSIAIASDITPGLRLEASDEHGCAPEAQIRHHPV